MSKDKGCTCGGDRIGNAWHRSWCALSKMETKKEIIKILFRHRANDRGNENLNLFEDKEKLEEQDEYYADEILKLFKANRA